MESANCTLTVRPTTQHGMLSICIRQDKPSFAVFLWAAPMTTTQGLTLLGGARLRAARSVSFRLYVLHMCSDCMCFGAR